MSAPTTCPFCGSPEIVDILYGLPTGEAFLMAERGEIALGGCVVWKNDPTRRCQMCAGSFTPGVPVEKRRTEERRTERLPKLGPRFEEALSYAAYLHANQWREETEIPYVSHLLGVASLVLEDGGPDNQAMAGLLHDAAEDQGGESTLAEIRERFGPEVESILRECSDSLETPKPSMAHPKREVPRRSCHREFVRVAR